MGPLSQARIGDQIFALAGAAWASTDADFGPPPAPAAYFFAGAAKLISTHAGTFKVARSFNVD